MGMQFKKIFAVIELVMFMFMLIFVGVCYMVESYSCKQSWKDSGMYSRYNLSTGCMVEVKKDIWIPARFLRGSITK